MEFKSARTRWSASPSPALPPTGCTKKPTSASPDVQKQSHLTLQSLLHIQQNQRLIEFLEHIKVDLSPDAVYVFTPKSKILSLPRQASALDFAYAIHTDIGNRAVGAIINGIDSPISQELHNGDRVQIITDADAHPAPIWLKWVKPAKHAWSCATTSKPTTRGIRAAGRTTAASIHRAHQSALPDEVKDGWERLIGDVGSKRKKNSCPKSASASAMPTLPRNAGCFLSTKRATPAHRKSHTRSLRRSPR